MPRRRTLKAQRAKRSASRKRQGGAGRRGRRSWCNPFSGCGTNNNENENEEMSRLNAIQAERVAAAAAETRRQKAEERASYGARTRAAEERARQQAKLNSAADHGIGVVRQRKPPVGPIASWQKETVI